MIKRANWGGRNSKKLILKDSIKFLNRSEKKFDWDNDKLSEIEVKEDQSKMIHPNVPAEIPGIELESNLAAPSRV